jgi:hypothetical protein
MLLSSTFHEPLPYMFRNRSKASIADPLAVHP